MTLLAGSEVHGVVTGRVISRVSILQTSVRVLVTYNLLEVMELQVGL